jgi:hypothetical protein
MPVNQTAPNQDLQRLVDEGYEISLEGSYLLVHRVPYVRQSRTIGYATMISPYAEHNGVPTPITDHTVFFTGSVPHRDDGASLETAMVADTQKPTVAGRAVLCRLSNKPEPIGDMLSSYYNKLTHYIGKLGSYASAIDTTASARGTGSFTRRDTPSVFHYPNWASARSGLEAYEAKLELRKVAIVGLGGTGAYIFLTALQRRRQRRFTCLTVTSLSRITRLGCLVPSRLMLCTVSTKRLTFFSRPSASSGLVFSVIRRW